MSKDNHDFFSKKKDWSEIKDRLLEAYLLPYFQKILATKKPVRYVDCFAGKGKFDDGKDGSPRVALRQREMALSKSKIKNNQINCFFIEKKYPKELKNNLADFDSSVYEVVDGKFEDKIENLLQKSRQKNVFLYIDPYGIKELNMNLFDRCADRKFGLKSIELLINLNTFGFLRAAYQALNVEFTEVDSYDDLVESAPSSFDATAESAAKLDAIAGGDYWRKIVADYQNKIIDGYEAEKRFSAEYKRRLKKSYRYVLDLPIRIKSGNHPKYRLVHASNHEDACILMAQNIAKRKDELFVEIQQAGQLGFLRTDADNRPISSESIEDGILQALRKFEHGSYLKKLLASYYDQIGVHCVKEQIRDALNSLERKGKIIVTRTPPRTQNGKPTRFWDESNDQTIFLQIRA